MKTKEIIKSVIINRTFKVDITQDKDSFNGLVYRGENLVCCVAAGLHEGIDMVVIKAIDKTSNLKN